MYQRQPINFKKLLATASSNLGYQPPKMLRGVKGLTNVDKTPEMIEKGILGLSMICRFTRMARYGLMALTHH